MSGKRDARLRPIYGIALAIVVILGIISGVAQIFHKVAHKMTTHGFKAGGIDGSD
jgi:archaellum biogenesis protein FlaJ (TadC family)